MDPFKHQITASELAWALQVAPGLGKGLIPLLNDAYTKGVKSQPLIWHSSWTILLQARFELLKVLCDVYMLGRLFRFLGSDVRTVVLVPLGSDVSLKAPSAVVPFTYDPE